MGYRKPADFECPECGTNMDDTCDGFYECDECGNIISAPGDQVAGRNWMKETELIGCFDARVWASEFCKRFPNNDEGTMLGWFANAIMAGYDKGIKDAPSNAQQQIQPD